MAQTVAYYQNKMLAQIAATPVLSGLTSPSMVSLFNLFTFVVASCINLFEQVLDIFKTEIEDIAAKAVPGTNQWIQNEIFKFQYDATTPQIIELVDLEPAYPVIDTTKQIITRCTAKTLPNRIVSIKVAKSSPPAKLLTAELNALKSYLDIVGFAGVQPNVISIDPDRLYLKADIYFTGSYAAIIQASVIAAINTFLANLSFDGIVRVSALEKYILTNVPGVTDVVIEDLAMRANSVLFANTIYVVQGYDTQFNKYPTIAGYIIAEDTAGQTLADKLNFIVEA